MLDYQTETSPDLLIPLIRAWLRRNGKKRPLVVLDTLGKVMPVALRGEGDYQRDYRIGSALKRLVDAHPGACLLVVHHSRKAASDDWMDSTSGTNGLNGAADWTINLSRSRNEGAGVLRVTGRDVPEGEYALTGGPDRWAIDGDGLTEAATKAAEDNLKSGVGDRAAEIIGYVATQDGPVTPKEVQDALGLPAARRYLARLAATGRLEKVGRGQYACPAVPTVPTSHPEHLSASGWDNGTHGTPPTDGTCRSCHQQAGKPGLGESGRCVACELQEAS